MSTPHLADEQLSAALDGEDPGALEHASSCEVCAARLDQLRAAAALVGTPVAVPADDLARERAVAAALGTLRTGATRTPGRWMLPAAIAAVVLASLIVVPLAMRDDSADKVASEQSALSAPVDGGDLGVVSDPQELRARVSPFLGESAAVADAASSDDSGEASSDGALSGAGGSATAGSPGAAPTTTAVVSTEAAPVVGQSRTQSLRKSAASTPCASATTKTYGKGLGPLVYSATLVWQGTPAVALGYPVLGATSGLDRRVFVVSRADCTLLLVFSV